MTQPARRVSARSRGRCVDRRRRRGWLATMQRRLAGWSQLHSKSWPSSAGAALDEIAMIDLSSAVPTSRRRRRSGCPLLVSTSLEAEERHAILVRQTTLRCQPSRRARRWRCTFPGTRARAVRRRRRRSRRRARKLPMLSGPTTGSQRPGRPLSTATRCAMPNRGRLTRQMSTGRMPATFEPATSVLCVSLRESAVLTSQMA